MLVLNSDAVMVKWFNKKLDVNFVLVTTAGFIKVSKVELIWG